MLFFFLYNVGVFLALIIPVNVAYTIASIFAYIKYLFSFLEKKEIVENLKLVLPGEDSKTLKSYAREIFKNFSMYLVDFFRFKKLDLEYVKSHIEIVNKYYLDDALKKGKGVIALSAHLGNWELGGAVMGVLGYPINAIALEHRNRLVNNFFVRQRCLKNERVIPIGAALKRCFSVLKNNELLAILGDKDFTNGGVVVKFFGRDTILPKGPAVFSLKTGAVIVPGFLIRKFKD
ncbi:MAG: lysophospholipid acyltransferase family protein, partial [Candidatus Omnitrophica bacterium]|nr:lysophospholipid acyltransferase family protein [Candidatus Omnitrophota bacterium]